LRLSANSITKQKRRPILSGGVSEF
jgi:hypothetical protein